MDRSNGLLVLASVSVLLLVSSSYPRHEVVRGNNAFALDVYAKLAELPDRNLFFSPYSISTALAMTYAGARGKTAAEMAEVLHFEGHGDELHATFRKLIEDLNAYQQSDTTLELHVANALWLQAGFELQKEFLELLNKYYHSILEALDFARSREAAAGRINAWVEEKTKGKIANLVNERVLPESTKLVLTNAIYFKADWRLKFDERSTEQEKFILASGTKVDVPLMKQVNDFSYLERPDFQALELPYGKEGLSMVVFLPKTFDGHGHFESSLNSDSLTQWLSKLTSRRAIVYLPKFKLTEEFSMAKTLKQMGMNLAFSRGADFTGIRKHRPWEFFYISDVLHKAFVDVSERGTEAAAATAVVMEAITEGIIPPPPPPVVFRADHPFFFLIRDARTGSILFMGRLMNPVA